MLKIKPIKTSDKKKEILISAVGFAMKTKYRNAEVYTKGLITQLEYLDTVDENFVYRLYVDESIIDNEFWVEAMEEFVKRDYTEVYEYDYPPVKDGSYHNGTFGTMMRFMPLFETKKEKDWDMMTCIDVDMELDKYDLFGDLNIFKEKEQKFMMKTPMCYHLRGHRKNMKVALKHKMAVIALGFASKMTFNKKLMTDFLKDFNSDTDLYRYYKEEVEFNRSDTEEHLKVDRFTYGVDEYFLTDILLALIIKEKIPIAMFDYPANFYLFLKEIREDNNFFEDIDEKRRHLWDELLRKILGKFYDENKTTRQNFNFVLKNSICYVNNFHNKMCRKLSQHIVKIFKRNQAKLYGLDPEIKKCFYFHIPKYRVYTPR